MTKQSRHQSRPTRTAPTPVVVWAVGDWNNCTCEHSGYIEGTSVLWLFATEQTADQYLDHRQHGGYGWGTTTRMRVPGVTTLPATVFAVCQWNDCQCEDYGIEGSLVVGLHADEKAAAADLAARGGPGYGHVTPMRIHTRFPAY